MSFKLSTLMAASLLLAACSKGPEAQAPGSNPEDMTPEGHAEAAEQEHQEGDRHDEMAEDVEISKPAVQHMEEQKHKRAADKHHDFAGQHERAGEAAPDGGTRK